MKTTTPVRDLVHRGLPTGMPAMPSFLRRGVGTAPRGEEDVFVEAPPGVPRSGDRVPAWLEHGEAVLPKETVKEIGTGNIEDLIKATTGKNPASGLGGERRFADGLVPEEEDEDLTAVPASATPAAPSLVPPVTTKPAQQPAQPKPQAALSAPKPSDLIAAATSPAAHDPNREAGLGNLLTKQASTEEASPGDPGSQILKSLANNEGARNTFNVLQESKGSPVSVATETLADGRSVPLFHGSGGGMYTAADGTPTADWNKTAAYAEGVKRAEKDKYDAAVLDMAEAARTKSGAEGERQKQAFIAAHNLGPQGFAAQRNLDTARALQQRKLLGEVGLTEARTALAGQQRGDALAKGEAAVSLFLEQNPNATPAQIEAVRRGVKLGDSLSPVQQRGNAEIDAARAYIAGMGPEEIRRRTAKTTDTGRDNPDFDPALERAARLSSRRKIGADDWFDQRQAPARPEFDRSGIEQRFRTDKTMGGYTLGKEVPGRGVEVLDKGRVVGYYR